MAERARTIALLSVVWPDLDGNESIAKRAAATHLLLRPDKNSSSMVAQAVRAELGASLKSLGLPPFRQLLQKDTCFTVEHATLSEANIILDSSKLSKAAQQRLTRAVDTAFPLVVSAHVPPEAKVYRAVAQLLLQQQGFRASCSWVAAAVDQSLGSRSKLGITSPFRQLITSDSCFKLTPSPVQNEVYIKLNCKQLLQRAHDTRQSQDVACQIDSRTADTAGPHEPSTSSWPSLSNLDSAEVGREQQPARPDVSHKSQAVVITPGSATSWLAVALAPASPSSQSEGMQQRQRQQQIALADRAAGLSADSLRDLQFEEAVNALQAAALRMMP